MLKEHVLFVGAKQAHDAIHFESAFTAALQRLGEYGIGIDRDSFGSAHSDRDGTESSTAIKQTFRVRAYEAKHLKNISVPLDQITTVCCIAVIHSLPLPGL